MWIRLNVVSYDRLKRLSGKFSSSISDRDTDPELKCRRTGRRHSKQLHFSLSDIRISQRNFCQVVNEQNAIAC